MSEKGLNSSLAARSWLAVIACALAIFNSGALFFGYPGVLTVYCQQELGASSGQTGWIMTFACLGVGLLMFLSGSIHAKIGTRKCFLIGSVILLADMFLATFADSMWLMYLWAFLVGAGNGFIYGPGVTTVQNWMPKRRGLASGILNLAFGTAAAIMSPIYTGLIGSIGFKNTNYVVMGMIVVLTGIALTFSELPQFSKLPDSLMQQLEREKAEAMPVNKGGSEARSYTPREAVRTKGFWMLWLCWAFMGAAGIAMVSLSGPYAISIGLASATVLTAFNLTNGIGRIVAGTLSDLMGRNATCCIAFAVGGVGYVLLPFLRSLVAVGIGAARVGLALRTPFSASAPRVSDLFGL